MVVKKKTPKSKRMGGTVTRGKRKESLARASIIPGKGVVRINSQNLNAVANPYTRELMYEPLRMAPEVAQKYDISVNIRGGGAMGQAQAARLAIARALVKVAGDPSLKERMLKRDKFMLLEDSRRVEPKKYLGPKARARFQKSYR